MTTMMTPSTSTSMAASTCTSSSFVDDTETITTSKSMDLTPASSLILEAAERIQFKIYVEDLLPSFEVEMIREVWQLEYLDSIQYKSLGLPMGLVASVRRCLEERRSKKQKLEHMRSQIQPIGRSVCCCVAETTTTNTPAAPKRRTVVKRVKRDLEVIGPTLGISTRSVSTSTLGSVISSSSTTPPSGNKVSSSTSSCSSVATSIISTCDGDMNEDAQSLTMPLPNNNRQSSLVQRSTLIEESERDSHWTCLEHESSGELPLIPVRFASNRSLVKSSDVSTMECS